MAIGVKRTARIGLIALASWAFYGCQEEITVELDGGLIPVEALTVEVVLPFQDFAKDLEGWGGYGRPYELARDIVARAFGGSLDSRVLNSWNPYPVSATVRDSTGVFATDSTLTFVGGRIVARFDTLSSILEDSVTLVVSALSQEWDHRSVGWETAVDSIGDRQYWDEAGGGPVTHLATVTWSPAQGDSAIFLIDSAGAALWADTAGARKGLRLEATTEGTRLDLLSLGYSVSTRPSVHPDTLVDLTIGARSRSFIYQPVPEPPAGEIRVGGVPAWRSLFTMDLPETLNGPPELCQKVQCPLELKAESLISASLILTTKAPPPAFQPKDSLFLDVRPVLEPSRLPKSPLGQSVLGGLGVVLDPEEFGDGAGAEVEIPLGRYVENLIANRDNSEFPVPRTLALLSAFEPLSLYFVAFEGPDSPDGPELRLILTLSDDVQIR